MIERPNANELMQGPLGQWLAAQNGEREAVKQNAARVRNLIFAGAAVLAVVIFVFFGSLVRALQFGGLAAAGGWAAGELVKRPMLNKLKGGINGAIAKALGLDYSVEVEPGRTFELAKLFEMLPSYDDEHFQDLWWGTVGGQPFTLHEAKLTEQQGSGKNRRTVTVFEGAILSIGFNRRFHSTTLLEPDGERRKFLIGAEKEEVTIADIALERADLVNPGFEDRFTVWTTDQVEARYIVHPAYVERLLAVEAAFLGQDIRALFHDGDMLITLQTGDQFESGSLDASDDAFLVEQAIQQFGSLADLAVTLNERARMTMRDLSSGGSGTPPSQTA